MTDWASGARLEAVNLENMLRGTSAEPDCDECAVADELDVAVAVWPLLQLSYNKDTVVLYIILVQIKNAYCVMCTV